MRRSLSAVVFSFALFSAFDLRAQGTMERKRVQSDVGDGIVVRTFALQSLSPKDAAKLVSPYTMFVNGAGVFEAGDAIRAITVRGTSEILARVDSILRANDHPRATLVLRFQLIAASDSAAHDPAISAVDTELRNLFKFAGYRLLSQGSTTTNEGESFVLTMSGVGSESLKLSGRIVAVQPSGTKGTAQLFIMLERPNQAWMPGTSSFQGELLSTGLTVPLGQTVVLGSAAYGAAIPAIILAVRPEVAAKP